MTYKSFKRVLGESSLERKCRFLFGACMLLLITGSFWSYFRQTERLVYEQNRVKGRLLVDTIMQLTHWNGLETNPEFREQVVNHLIQRLQREKYEWAFLRPHPRKGQPQPPLDPYDRDLLDKFVRSDAPAAAPQNSADSSWEFEERLLLERSEYQYFQPIRAQSTCLGICHQQQAGRALDPAEAELAVGGAPVSLARPLTEGDVMTVVKVQIPYGPTLEKLNTNRAFLLTTAIVTVALAMLAAYAIVRYVIVKPLKHLRDVSDAISRGDINQRADIRTGDEFQALAAAFNRMLRHLVDAQDAQHKANRELDAKVDQLAQANMRLFELNRMKSDFLATMSHELRTPLNSILGFSDVLGSIESLDEKQKRYVQNIRTSGKILLDMINDVLDLAKIESGKMDLRLSDFRIDPVVVAQCDLVRPLTEKKNIDLEYRIEPNLPPLHQDQVKTQQVLNNLLSNATKFTPEGGRILVTARRTPEGMLLLQVEDTGVGIAEEDQKLIFEKFRQGQAVLRSGDALTRDFSGTGLGLSIVRELCKLLGGEVSVQSELGKGSTFSVLLPWQQSERPKLDTSLADLMHEISTTEPVHRNGNANPAGSTPLRTAH